jgi:hypothetical protein
MRAFAEENRQVSTTSRVFEVEVIATSSSDPEK